MREHNERQVLAGGVTYEVIGWESVRGTARRPQEAINELITESHFLIALFKKKWGSATGSSWGFTSGTEEELFTGLLELGRSEQPMRDIWLAFVDGSDPDPPIVELRDRVAASHALMYENLASDTDLKAKLRERLVAWEPFADAKIARNVDLLSSSGRDALGAQRHRFRGEKLIELGQGDAGLAALNEAYLLGGPSEALAYARHLARSGDLERARAATERAIEFFTSGEAELFSPLAAEAFAAQAGLLRRHGLDVDAIGRLEHALTLITETDAYALRIRCRILDELGLAHQKRGALADARAVLNNSLELRRGGGSMSDVSQSLINLARLEVKAGNLAEAAAHATEASNGLRSTPPSALHANAEVLLAQLSLRQSRPAEGLPHAERALALNRQLTNRRGEAISLLLLAQCHRAIGNEHDAIESARACRAVNDSIADPEGARRAQWILDKLGAGD